MEIHDRILEAYQGRWRIFHARDPFADPLDLSTGSGYDILDVVLQQGIVPVLLGREGCVFLVST